MQDSSLIYQFLFSANQSQVVLVFGQINEGNPCHEYLRDAFCQDVLIFIDNVFRFLQAGSNAISCGFFEKKEL